MDTELSSPNTLCGSLSYHESDKESFYPEMLKSDVSEGPNEVADEQFHQSIDNFQIIQDEKWSFLHDTCTKFSKLENKICLKEKQLVYNGFAGDLISPRLHQHMPYKIRCYNSNEYLSQPIQSLFNETPYDDNFYLKASPTSKLHKKNVLSANEHKSLVFTATTNHGLKKQASQFEDPDGNSYDVMRDEPGIEERTVPESYEKITKNKANYSLTQKNISESIHEVCETYSHFPECKEKWKHLQRFIKEKQLIYQGSAGDLISFIHESNAKIPRSTENSILKSLSQPRVSLSANFFHKVNYDSNVCEAERMISSKTATTVDDKVIVVKTGIPEINHISDICSTRNDTAGSKEITMQHIITDLVETKSIDSQLQSKVCKVISKVSNNETSVAFIAECSLARNWKWKNIEKYNKEQQGTYSTFAGEIITSTSRMCVHTSQMRQATSRSLSQPIEYVGNKLIKETMSGGKSNFKVSRDMLCFISFNSSIYNANTNYEKVMLSNMSTAEEINDTASSEYPQINQFTENSDITLKTIDEPTETTIAKDVYTNNPMQSYDMLNISTKYPLIDTNSWKILQEQLDQIVPNKINTVDYETDEFPCIVHYTDSPRDARNSECKRLSPDIFADKDDISLYADSPRNILVDNTYMNTDIKEIAQNTLNPENKSVQKNQTVNDTPIYKFSQNIPKQLKTKENDGIDGLISRVEKKTDLVSLEDESLTEDADCLYASDMFPVCLTQPAVPTYLLRNCRPEPSDNSSKGLETDAEFLGICPDQCFQEKTEKTTDNTNINSFYENENIHEDPCKSMTSKIILCTTPSSSALLCHQNSVVLTSDTNNSEAYQQKMVFSVSSNYDVKFEENNNIQTNPQNDKLQLNNQQSYNKNALSLVDENCDTQLYLSPSLENHHEAIPRNLNDCMSASSNDKYQQAQCTQNLLVSKGDVIFNEKLFKQLDSGITSAALQNAFVLKKQKHIEKIDSDFLINKPKNDRQRNQVIPVNSILESENCVNAAQKQHSNNHPGLTQHSPSNEVYLDIAENLCNEYSLDSINLLKRHAKFKDIKEEDYRETDKCSHSSSEEYDSDVSISEVTSESNIDLHIDNAIEKYQNTSPGSEKTCIQGAQNKVNSMEVSVQTDICGLTQMEQCICKNFKFSCELCNENLPEVSENKAEKRQAISSDSEMPMSKRAKCHRQKTEMINCSNNAETESKMDLEIKCTEDIKTLSQIYFNKSFTSPQAVINDNCSSENKTNHHDVQGLYQHTQLFSWYTAEKNETLQRSQEVNEQDTQQNPKPRAYLRIGLSKRAKTKSLHYSRY